MHRRNFFYRLLLTFLGPFFCWAFTWIYFFIHLFSRKPFYENFLLGHFKEGGVGYWSKISIGISQGNRTWLFQPVPLNLGHVRHRSKKKLRFRHRLVILERCHNVKTVAATSGILRAYMLMAGYGRHEVQMDWKKSIQSDKGFNGRSWQMSSIQWNLYFGAPLSKAPNDNFWKMSVRKTIWDLEFSEHLLLNFLLACLS